MPTNKQNKNLWFHIVEHKLNSIVLLLSPHHVSSHVRSSPSISSCYFNMIYTRCPLTFEAKVEVKA